MNHLTKLLIASTALLTLPAFAQAQSNPTGSEILNGQTDFHLSLSNLNVQVQDVSGNVSGTFGRLAVGQGAGQ